MSKSYIFSENERRIATVKRKVWYKALLIARELDLDKGGLYDSRASAVNIWVAPEDKPADWTFPITEGALAYPRAYLASIYGNLRKDGLYDIYLTITNYERKNQARKLWLTNRKLSSKEYLKQIRLAEKGSEEEWAWAEKKATELLDLAQKEAVFKTVLYCPFCGKQGFRSFEELLDCIRTHVEVKSVTLGVGIETSKGLLTRKDYTRTVMEVEE